MTTSSNKAKTPLANVSSGKDNLVSADRPFISDCAHCHQPFNSKGPAASLCMKCFVAGHRGFTCGKYCIVTPASAALAEQFGSSPTTQPTASASAPTQDVTDHDVVGSGLPESNVTVAVDDWMLNHSMTTVRDAPPESPSQDVTDKGSVQHEYEPDAYRVCKRCGAQGDVLCAKGQAESSSSISSVVTEIRERQADGYEKVSKGHIGNAAVVAVNDVRRLLSIIDRELYTETGDYTLLAKVIADRAASNMRDEIVKRVREKAEMLRKEAEHPDYLPGYKNKIRSQSVVVASLATELEAIEVKDDPYPCPRCGAPDTANLATPPEVSIGCRECGWEAVTIKENQ